MFQKVGSKPQPEKARNPPLISMLQTRPPKLEAPTLHGTQDTHYSRLRLLRKGCFQGAFMGPLLNSGSGLGFRV